MPKKKGIARKVRWTCPEGEHPGVLGSTRPPMDSIVRYCLPCSERSGRLVKRVAPALEREREARRQARSTAPARAAESLAKRAIVECHDAAGRLWTVDLIEEVASCCEMLRRGPLVVTVTRADGYHVGVSGRAWPLEGRVHLTVGPKAPYEDLVAVVLHEVVHTLPSASVIKDRGKHSLHGPRFKRELFRAARERWPRICETVSDLSAWERTGKAYDLDRAIESALRDTCPPLTDPEKLSIAWESPPPTMPRSSEETDERVLEVIPLGMRERIGSDEIASRAGVSKSTVLRALRELTHEPALVRSADRWTMAGYRPGYYRTG